MNTKNVLVVNFENVLNKCENKTFVSYWNDEDEYKTLTYKDVYHHSINIIETLERLILENHRCIGLFMNHNPFIPSLMISLQKCNIPFTFLDPHVTFENNLQHIESTQLKWIISDYQCESIDFLQNHATLTSNFNNEICLKLWRINSMNKTEKSFERICYVISTSGTTSIPKIVAVEFECIISNVISLSRIFNLSGDDVIYFGTPLTFDPSIIELFLTFYNGCSLMILPPKAKINPSLLLNKLFLNDCKVTVLQMVPSLFSRWKLDDIRFILQSSSCKILAFGGESFPQYIFKYKKSENLRIFNLYGITEVSCWASCHEVKDCTKQICLGKSLDDTILEVRNNEGSVITNGEGELFIGSFSRICYINEDVQNLRRPVFRKTGDIVRIESDNIFYLCRKENTIKRYGIKINLSVIERAIFIQTELLSACIWIENTNKLILFVVISEFNPVTKLKIIDKLRVRLLHTLPKEYFPDHIEIIPSLPTTKNGKIDKSILEQIYKPEVIKDPIELFKSLWIKYIGITIEDEGMYTSNFFEAGGNSFSAIQFLSEFQELTKSEYSNLATLLFEKTLRDCCDFLRHRKGVKRKRYSKEEHLEIGPKQMITAEEICENVRLEIYWKYNMEACIDSSPKIVKKGETTLIAVGSYSHIFSALHCDTGAVISKLVLPDILESSCCNFPLNDNIFIGCFDAKMYCINIILGTIVWEYNCNGQIKSSPCLCLDNKALCFGSYDKFVHCICATTGNVIWKTELNGSIRSDILSLKKKLYVGTISSTCFCLNEINGVILWQYNVGAPIFGTACLFPEINAIVWPDVCGTLHSFSFNGEKEWTHKLNGNIYSSLKALDNFLLIGCHDYNFYCLQINNKGCSLVYKIHLDAPINAAPNLLSYKDNVYVITVSISGCVYLVNFNSGAVITKISLPGQVFSSPTILEDKIYMGCRDNNLYCVKVTEYKK